MMVEQYRQVGISIEVVEHRIGRHTPRGPGKENPRRLLLRLESTKHVPCVEREIQSTLQGPWWQGYENERVNALIEQAQRRSRTRRDRKSTGNFFNETDDAPWVFLYRPTNYWGVRST